MIIRVEHECATLSWSWVSLVIHPRLLLMVAVYTLHHAARPAVFVCDEFISFSIISDWMASTGWQQLDGRLHCMMRDAWCVIQMLTNPQILIHAVQFDFLRALGGRLRKFISKLVSFAWVWSWDFGVRASKSAVCLLLKQGGWLSEWWSFRLAGGHTYVAIYALASIMPCMSCIYLCVLLD